MPLVDDKGREIRVLWKAHITLLEVVSLLVMLWGFGGIVVTIYNNFIADSPPYLDYDWAEVMGRYILIFAVGCLIFGVSVIVYALSVLVKTVDYAVYDKDSE